jgi:putative flippase GtrA
MTGRSPLRYGFVAGICLAIHNAIVIAGDAAALPLLASVLVSFAVVVVVGYVLHSRLTFEQTLNWPRFQRYALAASVNIPLAFATLWFWSVALALPMIWASPIATVCTVLLNYLLFRWAIMTPAKPVE